MMVAQLVMHNRQKYSPDASIAIFKRMYSLELVVGQKCLY